MQRLLLELEEEEDGAGVMGMVNPVTICDFAAILRDAHKFNYCQETERLVFRVLLDRRREIRIASLQKKKIINAYFCFRCVFLRNNFVPLNCYLCLKNE